MEISELSLEEKIRFKELKDLWKEGMGFYWRVVILLFFFWQIIDIILTITFSPFGGRGFGVLPYIPFNMNNIVQLWGMFPVFFMVFGFLVSWISVKKIKKKKTKKLAAVLIILIWGAFFTYMMSIEPWIKDTLLRQILGVVEFLGFLGITIFLAIKVRWPRFIWVIAAYLGVLLTLYYGFYRPITLVLEYFPSPPSFSNLSFIFIILPVIGIISAIFMAWASSKKGLRWAIFSHILEERKKKRK